MFEIGHYYKQNKNNTWIYMRVFFHDEEEHIVRGDCCIPDFIRYDLTVTYTPEYLNDFIEITEEEFKKIWDIIPTITKEQQEWIVDYLEEKPTDGENLPK